MLRKANHMKIIFLDIDGVLNTEEGRKKHAEKGLPTRDQYEELFDEEAVDNLRMILEVVPDAVLVIESAWKSSFGGISRLREMWEYRNMPGKIHSVTEDLKAFPELESLDLSNFDNFMKVQGKGKGFGIKRWLEQHAPEDCKYVIIDDVFDFLTEQKPHVVCTDPRIGLTKEDADAAINLLK